MLKFPTKNTFNPFFDHLNWLKQLGPDETVRFGLWSSIRIAICKPEKKMKKTDLVVEFGF